MKKPLLALVCLLTLSLSARAEEEKTPLKMVNTPISDVLTYYGHLIGKQMIYDNSVQGQLTVVSDGPVNHAQAEEMIEAAIAINGFSLVDSDSGTLVKVIGLGKLVRDAGVPVYYTADEFPKHERVVTLFVKLSHLKAQQTVGTLSQYVPPSAVTCFTACGPNSLLVTAQTGVVRQLVKILQSIDVPDVAEKEGAPTPAPASSPKPPGIRF